MINKIDDVYSTTEYEIFKMIDGNRECTEARAKKIGKSIDQNGYITNPIIVNEKYEIIDGVGRFKALRQRCLPIIFVIHKGAGAKECAALNESTTKWKMIDYIKLYCSMGNQSYINLLRTRERYKNIPSNIVDSVCYGVFTKLDDRIIHEGKFIMSDQEMNNACEILTKLERFTNAVSKIPGRSDSIYRALAYIIGRNDVNIERLVRKMQQRFQELGQVVDTIGALAGIEKIYNERLSDGRIYFVAEYDKDIRKSNPSYNARWGKQLDNKLGCIKKMIK